MNKLFAIYMCALLIIVSVISPLLFPALLVITYVEEGFSGFFIFIMVVTILAEPLAITASYALLSIIKDVYNDITM